MNNDIVTKARLNAALGTEGNMGFVHNDIVTVDRMNEAIAEGGGGGGSSDFSTAQVTIANERETTAVFKLPVCVEAGALGEGSPALLNHDAQVAAGETNIFTVPLYQGAVYGASNGQAFTATGDCEKYSTSVLISGDCIITVTE